MANCRKRDYTCKQIYKKEDKDYDLPTPSEDIFQIIVSDSEL